MYSTLNTLHLAKPRAWRRNSLHLALAGAMLMAAHASFAQPAPRDVVLVPADGMTTPPAAKNVVLKAADTSPAAHLPMASGSGTPVDGARTVAKDVPVRAGSAITAPVVPPGTRSVQFSEWIKDNPDATRPRSAGSVPEGEIRLVLAGALQHAIERSPLLRQARAERQAAAADVREAAGQRWPQIDVGANTRARSMGGNNDSHAPSQALQLNMTTTLFDWGRTRNAIGSRKELSNAAEQKYLADLETLASDVSLSLVALEKAHRVNAISEQYVGRMSELVGMLNEIVSVDRGRASELTQAKARLMEAEAGRDAAQARVRDIQIKLRKLIGDAPVRMPENGDWALSTTHLDQLLAASQDHPALLQAEAEANAAERHAASLRAAERPQLNWVVSKSTGRDELGREQDWQTMVTMSWPLSRGGSARAAREAASLRADAERERKSQQQLELEFGIRAADQDAKTLLARAELYRQLTGETDSVRKAFFEQWYHLGRRTLLDVLIAESDYNNNLINEVTNRFDGYEAVLTAYANAGQLTRWMRDGMNPQPQRK